MGSLYVVSTPIGNLEDITLRAINTLKTVDTIISEDTRITKRLLKKFEIITKTTSYHKYNQTSKLPKIVESDRISYIQIYNYIHYQIFVLSILI